MHVHVPKPLQGWKAFFNEIVIIVIGVLIALGLEQVAEEIHWRHKVHEGEELLKTEAHWNFQAAAYQIAVAPCADATIEVLEQRILRSGDRLEPAPLLPNQPTLMLAGLKGRVANTATTFLRSSTYNRLNADGTIIHMPEPLQRRLDGYYQQVSINAVAITTIPLGELSKPLPLDASTRRALIAELELVRTQLRRSVLSSATVLAQVRALGWMPPRTEVEAFLRQDAVGRIAQCQKSGVTPADWQQIMNSQDNKP